MNVELRPQSCSSRSRPPAGSSPTRARHRVVQRRCGDTIAGGGFKQALVVLAIGAGSVLFSHVNDAGFWLIKEYLGVSVGQTIKTWSVLETILSVAGLLLCLLVGVFV